MFSERVKPVAIAEDAQEDPNLAGLNAIGDQDDGTQNPSTPQLAGGQQPSHGSRYIGNASPTFAEETPGISRQLTADGLGLPLRKTSSNASSPAPHEKINEKLAQELRNRVRAEEKRQAGAGSNQAGATRARSKSGGARHECQKPDFIERLQEMINVSIKELEEKLSRPAWTGEEAACTPATVQMVERSKYGGCFVDPTGQSHDVKAASARKLTMKERRENIDRIRGENYRHFQGVKTMMSEQGRQRASPEGRPNT